MDGFLLGDCPQGKHVESLIMEKVGAEAHASEFKTLKESNRSEYISSIRKSSDELIDNDLWELLNRRMSY